MVNKCLLLVVTFFLAIACKKNISKSETSEEKTRIEKSDDVYTSLKLNCLDNDGIIESCQYNNELKVKIDYNSNPNKINFQINKQNFIYNTGFIFEGVASNMFLYQKNSKKILIVEYGYEYSSKLLVFQIENNNVFFVQELEFDTPDSKYYYQIGMDSQYMYITLNSEKKEIKRININDINKKILEKIGKQNIEFISEWKGVYNYCVPNVRTDTIKSVTCHEITVLDDKASVDANDAYCTGRYKISGNKNELELKYDGNENECKDHFFKIKKVNGKILVYDINSPNIGHEITKE
ncbi:MULTISPECIES: hypothetical protein [Chryseobacterium]|uniref:hypothetical protein n=1 Tax=Chryseobacterium TaxID=59732 RepID=UPI0016239502|nr:MULTISPECIES: hypothetical protein [Chryseobacterium]MDM1553124.1 hypothetical protein [Chryseobacterium indologenes]